MLRRGLLAGAGVAAANVAIRSSQLYMNSGSGVSTAACVLCNSDMGTIRMMGVTTNSG